MNFDKLLGKQVFKNVQFQCILIVFKFDSIHAYFCICCVINNLLLMFMSHLIWQQFILLEFW